MISYSVVISGNYGFRDDYVFLDYAQTKTSQTLIDYTVSGRPLGGLLASAAYTHAEDVAGLSRVRFLGLLGLILAALCLYRTLSGSSCSMDCAAGSAELERLPKAAWPVLSINNYRFLAE